MDLPPTEFAKIPYLDLKAINGRMVMLFPMWDGTRWRIWIPVNGELKELPGSPVHADYVAKSPEHRHDLYVPFLDTLWQQTSLPDVVARIRKLSSCLHKVAASIEKLRLLHRTAPEGDSRLGYLASTEVDYVIITLRTLFDTVQDTVAQIWTHLRVLETGARIPALPQSFKTIVLHADKPRTASEIVDKYGLPLQLAQAYAAAAVFFLDLRTARDAIVHGLKDEAFVFHTAKGFAVDPKVKPFSLFTSWTAEHRYSDSLVSILPYLAYIILTTFDHCTALIAALASSVRLSSPLAPGWKVFVRGYFNAGLHELERCRRNESVWLDTDIELIGRQDSPS
jgi:hypothetical protein